MCIFSAYILSTLKFINIDLSKAFYLVLSVKGGFLKSDSFGILLFIVNRASVG